ncbi:CAMK family protein kinase [Trichomonas vaginalis G3]|uniref:CAMK family protein kinase n=1 Tax=Trichomonas vaginalis (strain ATCC PRA-98 / G3) TaxID=412133 RepID=A2D7M3_TRIV3|nr:protein serine/threonine kinase protein [Trichomonas vaginalis G3]EAY23740.1 CAMK family protein kinase [Trichomonas vaginalis G3]KAI5490235.1 protein serine/threonine kinase protein [Trichomonas vaginalis G3]|eukprot:XP_001276988.1 CAMK family protein kinase [Trichomonas vaginalis G3]
MSKKTTVNMPKSIKQYNVLAEVGHGAYGTVFRVFNKLDRRAYAIKVYPKSNLQTEKQEREFQREIDAMAYIKHPGLVALHDFFDDSDNFYLVMDYCHGGELFDYVVSKKRLDEPTAALVFNQIVQAVEFCHSNGIAHRDLKPENILIDKFPKVMVADFGLCGFIEESTLMQTFCGSPIYSAPEIIQRKAYDGRLSDVWSLGVILFGIVTGEHPWRTENTSAMLSQIIHGEFTFPSYLSDDCKDLISKMLVLEPSQRWTLKQVLGHPWIQYEKFSSARNTLAGKKLLTRDVPTASGLPLYRISEISHNQATIRFDHNIISPFEEEDGENPTKNLPRLSVRSNSLANLLNPESSENGNELNKSSNYRLIVGNHLSLAGNRQRSSNALLQPMSTFGD